MECKKCPYYEPKREITNSGKIVVGHCRLRSKHITDQTMKKELCKDRATIDVPKDSRTISMEPEKKLLTQQEAVQVARAQAKARSEPTFADIMKKKEQESMKKYEEQQRLLHSKPAQPKKADEKKPEAGKKQDVQVVPPMKLTPEEAMKLLDQQLSGKINAKFSKFGTDEKDGEKEAIRKAVWGGS